MRFLLDTNALSEPLKPRPDGGFLERLRAERLSVAISSVTWHEALFGLERLAPGSRRRAQVEEYLYAVVAPSIPTLNYDAAAAAWHASERARLERLGRAPPFADGQIAGIATTRGLILVTSNTADFDGFEGLSVASWLSAPG